MLDTRESFIDLSKVIILLVTMTVVFTGLFAVLLSAVGREQYPGQYADMDPKLKKWFQDQRVPHDGNGPNADAPCCSVADGTGAQEDIREGHYWVSWTLPEGKFWADGRPITPYIQVPDNVVIKNSKSPIGPVVWYALSIGLDGKVSEARIRCYVPGAKI